jgi:hypothetical protein
MQNKNLQDMTVVELKAHLFDLQGYTQTVQEVLVQKVKAGQAPVEEKKD